MAKQLSLMPSSSAKKIFNGIVSIAIGINNLHSINKFDSSHATSAIRCFLQELTASLYTLRN